MIPKEYNKQLWRGIILFVRKMNKTVSLGMFAKEKDDKLQSEVYALAARSGTNTEEQKISYQKAVETSAKYPLLRTEYLIEFAQWIFTNNQKIQDAEKYLIEAVKTLVELETEPGPFLSESPSKMFDFDVINADTESIPEKVRLTVSQHETLVRACVSLATLSPKKRIQYALLAHYFVMKMWELTVESINANTVVSQVQFELAQPAAAPAKLISSDQGKLSYFIKLTQILYNSNSVIN